MNDEIRLGQRVRDKVDGFQGVVVARTEWLWGCVRYEVQPEVLADDGQPLKTQWLDQEQLEVLDAPVVEGMPLPPPVGVATGGPARATGRPADPPGRPSGGP